MYAKLSKCDFCKNRIHYLGHIISEEGISVDPENIEAIMNWSIGHPICKLIKANIQSVQYKLSTQGSVLFQR